MSWSDIAVSGTVASAGVAGVVSAGADSVEPVTLISSVSGTVVSLDVASSLPQPDAASAIVESITAIT